MAYNRRMQKLCQEQDCERLVDARGMCPMHYRRWYRSVGRTVGLPPMERFMSRVDKSGPNGCWQWLGSLNGHGYGQFSVGRAKRGAHRWLWEQVNGPASSKLHLDHLCRNRACVNPGHLELVTHQVNLNRGMRTEHQAMKTHCPQGHPYNEANTGRTGSIRWCRECKRIRNEATRRKRALARQAF